MVTELGTELGTTLGTVLGTMDDMGPAVFDPTKLYAISGFSAANYMQTAVGGGEVGDAAGFGVLSLFIMTALPASSVLFNHRAGGSSTAGYYARFGTAGILTFFVSNGTTLMSGNNLVFTPGDVGRVQLVCSIYDGAARQLAWRGARSAGASGAYAGTGAVPHSLTGQGSVEPASAVLSLGQVTFRGMPSDAQLQAVYDATRTLRDLPNKAALEALTPGTTVTHRWSVRDTLAAANVLVANGAAAPASIPDSVTAASIDAMTKVGSPVVRVIDPATPRLWSYETTPILYGASSLDLSNFYECATPLGEGSGPFWAAMFFTVTSQAVASKARVPFASSSQSPSNISGFALGTSGTNTFVSMTAYRGDGSGVPSPSATIAATDVGKLHLLVGVLDSAALKVRTYWKRVEQSTGATYTAYTPSSTGMRLGRSFLTNDYSPDGISLWGVAAGIGLPSLAQIQAMFDETQANERIGSIAGMTSMRVDLTSDALGNGNALPATLTDRVGSFHFSRTGSVTTAAAYARAFGW